MKKFLIINPFGIGDVLFTMPLIRAIKENYLDKAMSIAEAQGVNCEPSGIAGLALMLQLKKKLPKNKKMLIVNTGKTKLPS